MTKIQEDADILLSYLDEIEEIVKKARLRLGVTPDVVGVDWRVKGGKIAPPDAVFAYAWVHLRDSDEVREEVEELVKSINDSYGGAVTLDKFVYSLSEDGRMLRRKMV